MRVNIREYEPKDFEEVVQMYHDMIREVYPNREFKAMQHFYFNVLLWIENKYDIIVTEKNGNVTGFACAFVDNMGGICEEYYQLECLFVKPEYRKGKSAFLLFNTATMHADSLGMITTGNASEVTESSHISEKFGKKIYTTFERIPT